MIDRGHFYNAVRRAPFNGILTPGQVSGTNALLDEWERQGLVDLRWLGCALGTTYHETEGTMQPIREIGKGKHRRYGVPTGSWHQAYYGRGDVQLTWEHNYQYATQRLRAHGVIDNTIDLDKSPDLAMRPDIAAAVILYGMAEGWFTGKKFANYFGEQSDWFHSRQIVNGMDRAALVASYEQEFYAALRG